MRHTLICVKRAHICWHTAAAAVAAGVASCLDNCSLSIFFDTSTAAAACCAPPDNSYRRNCTRSLMFKATCSMSEPACGADAKSKHAFVSRSCASSSSTSAVKEHVRQSSTVADVSFLCVHPGDTLKRGSRIHPEFVSLLPHFQANSINHLQRRFCVVVVPSSLLRSSDKTSKHTPT